MPTPAGKAIQLVGKKRFIPACFDAFNLTLGVATPLYLTSFLTL
jgi:hypothetical protein